MLTPLQVTALPVGAITMNGPLWVPCAVKRTTTFSPSEKMSSIVIRRSGKAVRRPVMSRFTPSGPRVSEPPARSWRTNSGAMISSTVAMSPIATSSKARRTTASFSADIGCLLHSGQSRSIIVPPLTRCLAAALRRPLNSNYEQPLAGARPLHHVVPGPLPARRPRLHDAVRGDGVAARLPGRPDQLRDPARGRGGAPRLQPRHHRLPALAHAAREGRRRPLVGGAEPGRHGRSGTLPRRAPGLRDGRPRRARGRPLRRRPPGRHRVRRPVGDVREREEAAPAVRRGDPRRRGGGGAAPAGPHRTPRGRRSLEEMAEHAAGSGVAIGLENRFHYHEFPGVDEMHELLAGYPPDVAGS